MQSFRRIDAWKRSHGLVLNINRVSRDFPRRGHATLKSQMVRAAESIPFNIVEGCGASSNKEFARYLDISVKSTMEVEYQLQLARDYGALSKPAWQLLTGEVIEIRKMLCGFRRSVLERDA